MKRLKKSPLRSKEIKEKKLKNKKYIILISAALFILMAVIYLIRRSSNITYNSFHVIDGTEWAASVYNKYLPYKNGIIKYNMDGAEAKTLNGDLVWNVPYNMKDPIIKVCDSYAAIADRGNKTLIIVDGSGNANTINVLHNISLISISKQGITAVITDNGMESILYVYNPDSTDQGDLVSGGIFNALKSGFPLDIAISQDGKKFTITFLQVKGENISTWISFYNLGKVGAGYVDQLVGSFNDDSDLFAFKLYYINEELCYVLKENGFLLYSVQETPKEIKYVDIKDEILQTAYSDSIICIVTKNNNSNGKCKVYCYNLKGKLISEFYMQDRYDKVMTSGKDIVFYSRTSFYICDKNGKVKIQGDLTKNIEYIYSINNADKYLLIGDGYMEVLKLLQ